MKYSMFLLIEIQILPTFIYQIILTVNYILFLKAAFSGVEFLSCSTNINGNILAKLTGRCKSIKEFELFIVGCDNNYGIIRLIEAQNRLD